MATTNPRDCNLCITNECCNGKAMLVGKEVPGIGTAFDCEHCDRVPAKVTPKEIH
ncbi:hypothetical protein BN970_01356 [Mycolicibacterium conceptionense]|uniref:Uncharacterized protein n=1 Tax=Mycolicibacterium conceptionense TaxID=451644 RepID=A0A0U1D390_9MYCO|nr:hypothetical protein [Mycolicibacterium conceptionense]CQD07220.1 hypothetical protein BN970_01356 [Mycolicibacterium conceptionense]